MKPQPSSNKQVIICESCGTEFGCGAETGKCWCFDTELTPETLKKLQKDFKNCLCPDCLKKT